MASMVRHETKRQIVFNTGTALVFIANQFLSVGVGQPVTEKTPKQNSVQRCEGGVAKDVCHQPLMIER